MGLSCSSWGLHCSMWGSFHFVAYGLSVVANRLSLVVHRPLSLAVVQTLEHMGSAAVGSSACGISIPRPGIKPVCLTVGRQTHDHWTIRKVSQTPCLNTLALTNFNLTNLCMLLFHQSQEKQNSLYFSTCARLCYISWLLKVIFPVHNILLFFFIHLVNAYLT